MNSSRADRIRARRDADSQGNQILAEFLRRNPGQRDSLAADPLGWIHAWPEIELVTLTSGAIDRDTSSCSIEGGYRAGTPARIGVGRSSPARMNFTALHELGHHLQRTSDTLSDALGERDDVGAALEEAASDAFAAAVLVPEDQAVNVLGLATPSAEKVAALWQQLPNASRHAVIVRAVKNLEAPGHVILFDLDGRVVFSASRGAIRVATGSDQSATAIGREIQTRNAFVVATRTRFQYGTLEAGETMYAQAAPMGNGYRVIVASIERVPWAFSVNAPEYHQYGRWHTCEDPTCVESFITSDPPCPACNKPVCPECGRCGCGSHVKEFTCAGCFMIKSTAEVSSTELNLCVDCA